jgi:hypothetical protein
MEIYWVSQAGAFPDGNWIGSVFFLSHVSIRQKQSYKKKMVAIKKYEIVQ